MEFKALLLIIIVFAEQDTPTTASFPMTTMEECEAMEQRILSNPMNYNQDKNVVDTDCVPFEE